MLGNLWDKPAQKLTQKKQKQWEQGLSFSRGGFQAAAQLSTGCAATLIFWIIVFDSQSGSKLPLFPLPQPHVSSSSSSSSSPAVADQGFSNPVVSWLRKPGWLKVVTFLYRVSLQPALHLSWCPHRLDKHCLPQQGWDMNPWRWEPGYKVLGTCTPRLSVAVGRPGHGLSISCSCPSCWNAAQPCTNSTAWAHQHFPWQGMGLVGPVPFHLAVWAPSHSPRGKSTLFACTGVCSLHRGASRENIYRSIPSRVS